MAFVVGCVLPDAEDRHCIGKKPGVGRRGTDAPRMCADVPARSFTNATIRSVVRAPENFSGFGADALPSYREGYHTSVGKASTLYRSLVAVCVVASTFAMRMRLSRIKACATISYDAAIALQCAHLYV